MKKTGILLALLLLVMTAACACAQELPGVDCFSPGFVELNERMKQGQAVSAEATLTAEHAFYARNLSVLKTLLDGTTLNYRGGGDTDELTLSREGETLMHAALTADETQARLMLDGQTMDISELLGLTATPDEAQSAKADFAARIQETPILERAALTDMADTLENAKAGELLLPSVTVVRPFSVSRTMSDDGERMTKIHVDGSVCMGGEEWTITGFIRHPGGKAPKDTAELVIEKNERSRLELTYSVLRKSEIEQKNRKGTASIAATFKLTGKIDGYAVHTTLRVNAQNNWTADGEKLNEKIIVTTTLAHKDNTPGKRMQRLNQVDAVNKNILRITTTDGGDDALSFTDEMSLKIEMDGNTFLEGGMKLSVTVGGEAPKAVGAEAQPADGQTVQAAFDSAVRALSTRLYAQLGEKTKQAIVDGL